MNATHYRNRWLKRLRKYETMAGNIIRGRFLSLARNVPFDQLTPALYGDIIAVSISIPQIRNTFTEVYRRIGLLHGKRVGEGINLDLKKEFDEESFEDWFNAGLSTWLSVYITTTLITSTRRSLIKYMTDFISVQLSQGVPFQEAVGKLKRIVRSRSFYSWQIDRIARTEAVSAANFGGYQAGERSGVALEKVWISAHDGRTRRIPRDDFDHWDMHMVTVPQYEMFKVPKASGGFENLRFPGDPNASIGNKINCRCTFGFVPKRDGNGDLIYSGTRPSARTLVLN